MRETIVKEIETRIMRIIPVEEIEQALCDQFDLGSPQHDDLTFEWDVTHPGASRHAVVQGIKVTQVTRIKETS